MMGIGRQALKAVGWVKAPKLMLARRHPRKAALLAASSWVTSRVLPRRRRRSNLRLAAQGLGAAAVAIPLGIWAGRKMMRGEEPSLEGGAER